MLYKGGILKEWKKKQAVAIQRTFYETLPQLPEIAKDKAEIAWFLYDLNQVDDRFHLTLSQTIYTEFWPALNTITTPLAGDVTSFVEILQNRLDEKQDGTPPDAPTITDMVLS